MHATSSYQNYNIDAPAYNPLDDIDDESMPESARVRIAEIGDMMLKHEAELVYSVGPTLFGRKVVHMEIWDKDFKNLLLNEEDKSAFDKLYDGFFVSLKNSVAPENSDTVKSFKMVLRSLRWSIQDNFECVAALAFGIVATIAIFALIYGGKQNEPAQQPT